MDRGLLGKDYADGEVICRQGDPGDRMYVIQAGCADVVREKDGAEVLVGELVRGDVFGEMAIVDQRPRSATVRAHGHARVLTLDRRAFLRGVHEDPSLAYRILQSMSRRIRQLDEDFSRLKSPRPAGRSAAASYLIIVSREAPDLHDRLRHALEAEGTVRVVLDRRERERRQRPQPPALERRRSDRRRRNVNDALRDNGAVLVRSSSS